MVDGEVALREGKFFFFNSDRSLIYLDVFNLRWWVSVGKGEVKMGCIERLAPRATVWILAQIGLAKSFSKLKKRYKFVIAQNQNNVGRQKVPCGT
jgi:hypothetical protein